MIVYPNVNCTIGTDQLYQWDYGQRLQIAGVNLPETYEVHFATSNTGESISVTGDSTGVSIPDELLESGNDILGWVFIKNGSSGFTKYSFMLKVNRRARPTEPRPSIIPAEGVEF